MNILGINAYVHDSAAALLIDGRIVAAVREERLDRNKHSGSFPVNSIKYCLKAGGINLDDIDLIVFPDKPYYYLFKMLPHLIRYFPGSLSFFRNSKNMIGEVSIRKSLKKYFRIKKIPKIIYMKNHLAHAAGAYYLSPFDKAAIFTADGVGTWNTVWMGIGKKNKLHDLDGVNYPHSLGFYYSAITQLLGFKANNDEYKVMALSAMGKPVYNKVFCRVLQPGYKQGFNLDLSYFNFHTGSKKYYSEKLVKELGIQEEKKTLDQKTYDIAASAQRRLEDIVIKILDRLYEKTQCRNLCLSGGMALNVVLNSKIKERTGFENVFVQPSCDDGGSALGAALYIHNLDSNKKILYENIDYLGPEYSNEEIELVLKNENMNYQRLNSFSVIAEYLSSGKIIALFDNRMEYGQRALGARSILADLRNPEMKDKLNKIKNRENFRPLAPVILEEHAGEYFENLKQNRYMTETVNVVPDKKQKIPACLHFDDTARVQTIPENSNLKLRKILEEYYKITGIPALINTSFNYAGDPIVCSPKDAIDTFNKMGLDVLVIDEWCRSVTNNI